MERLSNYAASGGEVSKLQLMKLGVRYCASCFYAAGLTWILSSGSFCKTEQCHRQGISSISILFSMILPLGADF